MIEEQQIPELVSDGYILDRFGREIERVLVGETNNAKLRYLAHTSRVFEKPVSIVIKGVSSGGKSSTVEQVLKFFPPSAYIERTGGSERMLAYSTEDFRHRHIVIYEAAGMNSDMMSYLIRTLISEGCIKYETVEKTEQGLYEDCMLEKMKGQNQSMWLTADKACSKLFGLEKEMWTRDVKWFYDSGSIILEVEGQTDVEATKGQFAFSPKPCADTQNGDFGAPREIAFTNGRPSRVFIFPEPRCMKTLKVWGKYK